MGAVTITEFTKYTNTGRNVRVHFYVDHRVVSSEYPAYTKRTGNGTTRYVLLAGVFRRVRKASFCGRSINVVDV